MAINGSSIESLFDYMVMSKGFIVSAPRTDAAQYDRIVDVSGRLYRVQIKARRGKGDKSMVIRIKRAQDKKYTIKDADIIALYIEDIDSWYLIPMGNCKHVFRLNLVRDKLDQYKNNWELFK